MTPWKSRLMFIALAAALWGWPPLSASSSGPVQDPSGGSPDTGPAARNAQKWQYSMIVYALNSKNRKFEYHILMPGQDARIFPDGSLVSLLSQLGEVGWELVTSTHSEHGGHDYNAYSSETRLYFKRPL